MNYGSITLNAPLPSPRHEIRVTPELSTILGMLTRFHYSILGPYVKTHFFRFEAGDSSVQQFKSALLCTNSWCSRRIVRRTVNSFGSIPVHYLALWAVASRRRWTCCLPLMHWRKFSLQSIILLELKNWNAVLSRRSLGWGVFHAKCAITPVSCKVCVLL